VLQELQCIRFLNADPDLVQENQDGAQKGRKFKVKVKVIEVSFILV
jgi:hypothetical protein